MFMTTNFFIMLAIVVYLAIMLVIGFVYSKRNNSTEDFYLGGRKMGPLVTAMSAEASDMSSWPDGTSGGCISVRYLRCRMDCHRSCRWYMVELVLRVQKTQTLFK